MSSRRKILPLAWNVRLVGAALAFALVLAAGNAVRADDVCPLGPPAGSPSCQPKFKLNGYDKATKTPSRDAAWTAAGALMQRTSEIPPPKRRRYALHSETKPYFLAQICTPTSVQYSLAPKG